MSTTTEKLVRILGDRKKELEQAEGRAERAGELAKQLENLEQDLARFQQRQNRFRALGDSRASQTYVAFDQRYSASIEWEVLSRLTGNQMAGKVERNLADVRGQIEIVRGQLEELAVL